LFGRLDPNFGALTPSASGCAPNTFPSTVNGITYCLDNTTQNFVYPYFERFCSLWGADKVYGAAVSQSSSHFIQEYIPQTIVQAVNTLNDPLALPVPCVANSIP